VVNLRVQRVFSMGPAVDTIAASAQSHQTESAESLQFLPDSRVRETCAPTNLPDMEFPIGDAKQQPEDLGLDARRKEVL